MNGMDRARGQPLLFLILLVAGWATARVIIWHSPFPAQGQTLARPHVMAFERAGDAAVRSAAPNAADRMAFAVVPPVKMPSLVWPNDSQKSGAAAQPFSAPSTSVMANPYLVFPPSTPARETSLSALPVLAQARTPLVQLPPGQSTATPKLAGADRWSADGWLYLRPSDAANRAVGPFAASYGRSQAGAVVRYRLAADDARAPSVYLRATAALAGSPEREVAAGLAMRPAVRLPLSVGAEMRLATVADRTLVRPAVLAVTEIPPQPLPLGLAADTYLQAGYVAGRFATPFVDGLVRIGGDIASRGPARVSAGGGVWGGAQNGAGRLDIGPSATFGIAFGRSQARVSADWRFRVAGDAEPGSGPALTVSAGF